MVRRRANERKPQSDVYTMAKRGSLESSHADVVIRSDHDVELTTCCAQKNGISRERLAHADSLRLQSFDRRLINALLFVAEQAAIRGVRIERAKRNARLLDAPLVLERGVGD